MLLVTSTNPHHRQSLSISCTVSDDNHPRLHFELYEITLYFITFAAGKRTYFSLADPSTAILSFPGIIEVSFFILPSSIIPRNLLGICYKKEIIQGNISRHWFESDAPIGNSIFWVHSFQLENYFFFRQGI